MIKNSCRWCVVCCAIIKILHFLSQNKHLHLNTNYKNPPVLIMPHINFMEQIRSFFGLQSNPPKNDFRNPIWSSDDEDDGDELYTRHQMEVFDDAVDLHHEVKKHMHDFFRNFGSMFGEFSSLFHEDHIDAFTSMSALDDPEAEKFSGNNIRDYYLKPGYQTNAQQHPQKDMDLDGKITSNEISGMFKQKNDLHSPGAVTPFNGDLVPGRSFCQTIITTSVTKSDGTVETRRIIKNGNKVIDEVTTTTGPETRAPYSPGLDLTSSTGLIYNHVISELSSFFRNFH